MTVNCSCYFINYVRVRRDYVCIRIVNLITVLILYLSSCSVSIRLVVLSSVLCLQFFVCVSVPPKSVSLLPDNYLLTLLVIGRPFFSFEPRYTWFYLSYTYLLNLYFYNFDVFMVFFGTCKIFIIKILPLAEKEKYYNLGFWNFIRRLFKWLYLFTLYWA